MELERQRLALRYREDASDKFWRVETDGCALVTNWGKTGTAGRYEIKEFEGEEGCRREAERLVRAKRKKGYVDMPEFDPTRHLYFDTAEYGPHPLTSHPVFRACFSDGLYYDCADEEAPFGSDEGSDALHAWQEAVRKRPKLEPPDFPRLLIEKDWGLTYLPPVPGQGDEELCAQAAQSYNGLPGGQELLQTDQVILATALGQVKVMGRMDAALQALAFQSLERMERLYRLLWGWNGPEPPYGIKLMRRDLERFAQGGACSAPGDGGAQGTTPACRKRAGEACLIL